MDVPAVFLLLDAALLAVALWYGVGRSHGLHRGGGGSRPDTAAPPEPASPEPPPRASMRLRVADLAELPVPGRTLRGTAVPEVPTVMPPPSRWAQVEWFVLPVLLAVVAPVLIVAVVVLTSRGVHSAPTPTDVETMPEIPWGLVLGLGLLEVVKTYPWWVVGSAAAFFVAPVVWEAVLYVLHRLFATPQLDGDLPAREPGWLRWLKGTPTVLEINWDEPDDGWGRWGVMGGDWAFGAHHGTSIDRGITHGRRVSNDAGFGAMAARQDRHEVAALRRERTHPRMALIGIEFGLVC